jgi:HK97 family phage major capsid protein
MQQTANGLYAGRRDGVRNLRNWSIKMKHSEQLDKAEAILKVAEAAHRDMNAAEYSLFNTHMDAAKAFEPEIQRRESQNTMMTAFGGPLGIFDVGRSRPTEPRTVTVNGAPVPSVDMERFNMELGAFMRGGMSAVVDTPVYVGTGAGVESVGSTIPTQVLAYLSAYYNLDSFALAGARQINTDNTTPLSMPIISAGAAASTYAEGAAPANSQPFNVDSFVFNGAKYSRLVKVSDEALMNSAIPLQGAILDELTASIATSFTAAITTAMLAALTANSGVFVSQGANDYYKTLGSVMHAIPPRFAQPTNKWMVSRATLAKIKDQRATGSGVPLFDPSTNQIFQKNVVINDNLTAGQVAFGDWMNGAIIRKSPFLLLPLREAFSSSGEVGFRATQFLDQHFLCECSDIPNQPLYYTVLS